MFPEFLDNDSKDYLIKLMHLELEEKEKHDLQLALQNDGRIKGD